MGNIEEKYEGLVRQYIDKLQELKNAQRNKRRFDTSWVHFLDQERNAIHNKLREMAPQLGKDRRDVDIDILTGQDNLSDHGIREFKLLRIETLKSLKTGNI